MMRPVSSSVARALAQSGADRGLPSARADVDRLREQLTTGLRINRSSDDPSGYTRARALGRVEQRLSAHQRSLDAATTWTDATQAELGALSDLFAEGFGDEEITLKRVDREWYVDLDNSFQSGS